MFPEIIKKRFKSAHYRPRTYKDSLEGLVPVSVDVKNDDGTIGKINEFVHQDDVSKPVVDSHVFDKSRLLETGLDKQLTVAFRPQMSINGVDMALDSYGNFKSRVDEQVFINSLMSKPDSKPDSKSDSKPDFVEP